MGKNHILYTPENCGCKSQPGYDPDYSVCPVCDWGLAVCSVCRGAEIELEEDCPGEKGIEEIDELAKEEIDSAFGEMEWWK